MRDMAAVARANDDEERAVCKRRRVEHEDAPGALGGPADEPVDAAVPWLWNPPSDAPCTVEVLARTLATASVGAYVVVHRRNAPSYRRDVVDGLIRLVLDGGQRENLRATACSVLSVIGGFSRQALIMLAPPEGARPCLDHLVRSVQTCDADSDDLVWQTVEAALRLFMWMVPTMHWVRSVVMADVCPHLPRLVAMRDVAVPVGASMLLHQLMVTASDGGAAVLEVVAPAGAAAPQIITAVCGLLNADFSAMPTAPLGPAALCGMLAEKLYYRHAGRVPWKWDETLVWRAMIAYARRIKTWDGPACDQWYVRAALAHLQIGMRFIFPRNWEEKLQTHNGLVLEAILSGLEFAASPRVNVDLYLLTCQTLWTVIRYSDGRVSDHRALQPLTSKLVSSAFREYHGPGLSTHTVRYVVGILLERVERGDADALLLERDGLSFLKTLVVDVLVPPVPADGDLAVELVTLVNLLYRSACQSVFTEALRVLHDMDVVTKVVDILKQAPRPVMQAACLACLVEALGTDDATLKGLTLDKMWARGILDVLLDVLEDARKPAIVAYPNALSLLSYLLGEPRYALDQTKLQSLVVKFLHVRYPLVTRVKATAVLSACQHTAASRDLLETVVVPATSTGPCPVCLDDDASGMVALPCGHVMHFRCVLPVAAAKRDTAPCPMCRRDMLHDIFNRPA